MPMDYAIPIGGAAFAALLMWLVTGVQHRLYSRPEHRQPGDSGRRRVARRLGVTAVAAASVGVALRPAHYDLAPALVTAAAALVLLLAASTDIERRLIPNRVNYGAALFAIATSWVWPDRSPADIAIGGAAALAIGAVLFITGELFAILLRVRVTPFGMGDVKLIVVIGLLLGWPALLAALLLGVVAAGIPAFVLTLAGQGKRVFPYGPFLVLGALIALLWPEGFV